jgi:MFS transporter, SP family, sugar:H+ symporter
MNDSSNLAATNAQTADKINTPFIVLISVIATIGGFLFGFDSGVINGTYDGLNLAFSLTTSASVLPNSMVALLLASTLLFVVGFYYVRKEILIIASIAFLYFMWEVRDDNAFRIASMLLGCAVGAFFAGTLADKYGRKIILIVSAVFFTVSAWGSGIATGSIEFVLYRVLGGLAVGAASVICPAYISEVAVAKYRGMLSSVQQVAIIVGLTAAFLSNYWLAKVAGSSIVEFWWGYETWRWMFWMELVPCILFLVTLFLIPESPRFLVASGQKEEAKKVLTKLYGQTEGNAKLSEIDQSLAADHHKPRLSDLVIKATQRIRPIVWVGIGLASLQQFVGINVVFYYGAVLWQAAGFSESDALLINIVSGAVSIAACFITFFVVDKVGRKPLLWIGSAGMAITLALVAYAFTDAPLDTNGKLMLSTEMGTLALVAANLYVVLFNVSWGPVMWIMLGEMFPNQIRGSALAIAGLAQWGANFIITITFPYLLASALGLPGAYSIYAAFSAISIYFVIKFVNETKGKELEQMEG